MSLDLFTTMKSESLTLTNGGISATEYHLSVTKSY